MAAVPGILRRWNPGILPGLNVWIDASDSSTINSNIDGTVNSIKDKTENSILLTQTQLVNKPTVTNTYTDGKQVIQFGDNLFLATSNFPFRNTISNFTNVKVFSINNYQQNSYLYSLTNSNLSSYIVENYSIGGGVFEFRTHVNTISYNADITRSNNLTQGFYTNSTSNTQFRVLPNEIVSSTSKHLLSNLNIFTLGKANINVENLNNFSGTVSEIIFYNRKYDSNSNLLNQLEGYLAWKWNLTESLPEGHPYASRPPS